MNKIKLPSMVEYVFEIGVPGTTDKQFTDSVMLFANFLSKQPNIGMFVPAVFEDGEWRILEAPNRSTHTNEECDQYATALDNVIFEGFEVEQILNSGKIFLINKDTTSLTFFNNSVFIEKNLITTIEDLIPYSLTLTLKFAKELGLI
jgi:hypothetical protein